MCQNFEKCRELLSKNPKIFKEIPVKLVNYDLCLQAVKLDGRNLKFVPEKFKEDWNNYHILCDLAVKQNCQVFPYVPIEHRTAKMSKQVIQTCPDLLPYVPEYIRRTVPEYADMNDGKKDPKLEDQRPCKIVLYAHQDNLHSFCIIGSSWERGKVENTYILPGTTFLVNEKSFDAISQNKGIKYWNLLRESINPPIYSLEPLRSEDYKQYLQGSLQSKDLRYKPNETKHESDPKLKSGSYGTVEIFPDKNMVTKTSEISSTETSADMVKEIAIYRLLKEISCTPKLYGFEILPEKKQVTINIELGRVLSEIDSTKMDKKMLMFRSIKCLRAFASQGLIHCDVKPLNMIVSKNESIQFIDWGIAEIDQSKNQARLKPSSKQSPAWQAPEIWSRQSKMMHYTYKIDVFSLGLVFIVLFSGKKNVVDYNSIASYRQKIFAQILGVKNPVDDINNFTLPLIENKRSLALTIRENLILNFSMPEDLADLISHMLEFNPDIRWSYDKLILHPFFQDMHRESIPKMSVFINNMPIIDDIEYYWNKNSIINGVVSNYIKWTGYHPRVSYLRQISQKTILELKKRGPDIFPFDIIFLAWQLLDLVVYRKPDILVGGYEETNQDSALCIACLRLADKIYDNQIFRGKNISSNEKELLDKHEKNIMYILEGNLLIPSVYTYYSHFNGVQKYISDADDPFEKMRHMYYKKSVYKISLLERAKEIVV